MNSTRIGAAVVVLLLSNLTAAETRTQQHYADRQQTQMSLMQVRDELAAQGLELSLGITNIYQQNLRGGLSTHRRAGRWSGSYDLELSIDMEKLFGPAGGTIYLHAEGLWSKSAGIDNTSVGSFFGVNGDAGPRRTMDVTEYWYEQCLFAECLRLRIGKMDLTGGFEHRGCPVSFDCSSFAGDETTQFLNGALVNNPTVPFPDFGLGLAVHFTSDAQWYVSAAVADAQADTRETGFATTFHNEDYFLYILEAGIAPVFNSRTGHLQGIYRAGLWYDPQPKANIDRAGTTQDDVGFYLTCDQMLLKENNDPEDTQGLGAFFRYGYADGKRNDMTDFWSIGFQYQGLLENRDDDVMGLALAYGCFSDSANTTYTDDYELATELYYNACVNRWLNITGGIQYVANPGGDDSVSDAVVIGIRAQVSF